VALANDEVEVQVRDHTVTISVTADEFALLEGMIPDAKERLGRRIVHVATVAYEVFQRGLSSERAS
jgi:hypothetical protein